MGLRRKLRHTVLSAIVLASAVAAALDGAALIRIHEWNNAIRNGTIPQDVVDLPATVQFAKAFSMERKGDHEGALTLYGQVETGPDDALKDAAVFNSANIYLRRALDLRGSPGAQQMPPLLELAKEGYRKVLRADSRDWDAKYNLEQALRLSPEVDETDAAGTPPRKGERAPTTMRGFTLGLP